MKVILAHPGTQYSFQLARQLYKNGLLHEFHTGFAYGKDSFLYKVFSRMPAKIYRKISNRFIDEVPDRFIKRQSFIEIKALLNLKLGQNEENVLYHRNQRFQESIPDAVLEMADAVIGFDTSSWILAERCKKLGKLFFLDVSIAHPVSKDRVYRQIIKRYPQWKFTIRQKDYKYISIEEAEIELAHHIVVASSFTLATYVQHGILPSKISVNPYGVDIGQFTPIDKLNRNGMPIRFVFVGLVDARKGIPFLLETWQEISSKNIELTLIGPVSYTSERFIKDHFPAIIVKGKFTFEEIKSNLSDYDVMIFPSFFEGFGLVIAEAMASGLPVITTTATCGPDVIINGEEGFIIDPGNQLALKEAIEYFRNDKTAISRMGRSARKKAEQLSWDSYGQRWCKIINSGVNG